MGNKQYRCLKDVSRYMREMEENDPLWGLDGNRLERIELLLRWLVDRMSGEPPIDKPEPIDVNIKYIGG